MFVLVTFVGLAMGWLVWQLQIVKERKAILAELEEVYGKYHFRYLGLELNEPVPRLAAHDFMRVSPIRRLLGDESCMKIELTCRPIAPLSVVPKLIGRMEIAFPEAELQFYDPVHECRWWRDSLYKPNRTHNIGSLFKTGLMPASPQFVSHDAQKSN